MSTPKLQHANAHTLGYHASTSPFLSQLSIPSPRHSLNNKTINIIRTQRPSNPTAINSINRTTLSSSTHYPCVFTRAHDFARLSGLTCSLQLDAHARGHLRDASHAMMIGTALLGRSQGFAVFEIASCFLSVCCWGCGGREGGGRALGGGV